MTSLGMGGVSVRVDMGAALRMAELEGCAPAVAPALLRAVQEGLSQAQLAEPGAGPAVAPDAPLMGMPAHG